jgi:hypothetical protein
LLGATAPHISPQGEPRTESAIRVNTNHPHRRRMIAGEAHIRAAPNVGVAHFSTRTDHWHFFAFAMIYRARRLDAVRLDRVTAPSAQ